MKKEAVAISLLVLLLAGSLYNIRVMDRVTLSLESEAKIAFEFAEKGDFDAAKAQLESTVSHWLSLDGYTHIFIRHTEIDSATDAFFAMLSDIAAEDIGSAEGSYGLLCAHLESLRTIEHLSLGSIF